jgi:peptide/nickel transport system substrate-binding protein
MAEWRNHVGVGTGPFSIVKYTPGSSIEFTKNPNYWDTTTIDGTEYQLPFVDDLVYTIIPDVATRLASLRTGKLDIWEKAVWEYKSSLAASNPEIRAWEVPAWDSFVVEMTGLHVAPLDDIRVRQALMMAVDHDYIIDTLFGGYGVKLNYPLPQTLPVSIYTPFEDYPEEVQKYYGYYPEDAAQLMIDAGYEDGFKAEALVMNIPREMDLMSLVADYWGTHLNVELELVPKDEAVFYAISDAPFSLDLPRFRGHMEDSPTPAFSLRDHFTMPSDRARMMWENAEFYDLMDAYWVEPDMDKSNAMLKEGNSLVVSQLPTLIFPAPNIFRYAWPWVMNYEGEVNCRYHSSADIYARIWIDQALKAEMGY